MDKLKCHMCGHYQVYAEHLVKDEKWRFFCRHCGKTTGYFSTHDEAEKEWERMEEEKMTREEAIQVLRDWDGYFIGHSSDDVNETLDMAIKSLAAWDEVQKEIYRQIDALDEKHEFRDKNAYFKALDIINKYLKEVEAW